MSSKIEFNTGTQGEFKCYVIEAYHAIDGKSYFISKCGADVFAETRVGDPEIYRTKRNAEELLLKVLSELTVTKITVGIADACSKEVHATKFDYKIREIIKRVSFEIPDNVCD